MKKKKIRAFGLVGILLGMALLFCVFTASPSVSQASAGDTIMFEQEAQHQRDPISSMVMFVLIPCGLSFVICSAFKAQMKSVHKAREASNYVTDNSTHITYHTDSYSHTTHVRTPIPRKDSRR